MSSRLFFRPVLLLGLAVIGPRQSFAADGWATIQPILETHCARCHAAGRTTGSYKDRPASNFGFILDQAELVKRNKLVPGNADGSQIYAKIATGAMPYDMNELCGTGTEDPKAYCGLSTDEKVALHAAIDALAVPTVPVTVAAVSDAAAPVASAPSVVPASPATIKNTAAFVTDREVVRLVTEDAAKASDIDRPNYRYFTFTSLVNTRQGDADLAVYRTALTKLLNSLSTESDPVVPTAIDAGASMYRVDISRLGWGRATWDRIVARDPYAIQYRDALFRALQGELATKVPIVRADWFVFQAARPPLYYSILDLPQTKAELQRRLGVDPARDFASRRVERAGFQQSGVSSNNRLIERHSIPTGAYWESYDFGSNAERKGLFRFPLGPAGAFGPLSDQFGFAQDGGEIIFTLPNGFHAYFLTNGAGKRLDTGPTNIVRDPSQSDLAVTDGISCFGCHTQGMKTNDFRPGQPLDQVRDTVRRSDFPSEAKELVDAIFPAGPALDGRLDSDAKHYAAALGAAGVPVPKTGLEVINALSKRYEDRLDLPLAAAELGVTAAVFTDRANTVGGPLHDTALRLRSDLVPREEFEALYATLFDALNEDGDKALGSYSPVAGDVAPSSIGSFGFAFYPNASSFKVGDLISFTLKTDRACFLTLLDTDDKGRSAVLFPNSLHPTARVEAGTAIQVPGVQIAGFQLRASEAGMERITATCNATSSESIASSVAGQTYTTFANSRDLVEAQAAATARQRQTARSRLIALEAAVSPAAPTAGPVAAAKATATASALLPVVAQASVVLSIGAK